MTFQRPSNDNLFLPTPFQRVCQRPSDALPTPSNGLPSNPPHPPRRRKAAPRPRCADAALAGRPAPTSKLLVAKPLHNPSSTETNMSSRRATRAQSLAELALCWPEIPAECVSSHGGQIIHVVMQHDESCHTINGGGMSECSCCPKISYHVQPSLQ